MNTPSLLPSDIQITADYMSTFGMWEMEFSARWMITYLQETTDSWDNWDGGRYKAFKDWAGVASNNAFGEIEHGMVELCAHEWLTPRNLGDRGFLTGDFLNHGFGISPDFIQRLGDKQRVA